MRTFVKTAVSLAVAAVVLGAPGTALAAFFTCTPTEVGVFVDRVHVKCATAAQDGSTAVWWFAVPASDTAFANRFLTTANTAVATAKSLVLYYNAGDTSGGNWGCGVGDCRSVWGIAILR